MSKRSLETSLPGLRRVLARLWPYTRGSRGLLAGAFVSLLGTIVLRLLEPWPLKLVFDQVLGVEPGVGGLSPGALLIVAAVGVVVITGLRALAQYSNKVSFAKIGNKVIALVRVDAFRHLQSLSLSFHSSSRGGDLTLRIIQDVNLLRDAAVTAILPLLAKSLVLVGMWGVMFWMNWRLSLLAAATVPLLWLRTVGLTKKIREAGRKQRRRQGALAATAAESIGAIGNVQALSLEGIFLDAFGVSSAAGHESDVRAARLSAGLTRSVDLLLALATALVLWYGARLALRGQVTPGELLVFLTYLRRAFSPAQDFAKYTARLAKATAAGERVLDLLDREPEIQDLPGAVEAPHFRGEVFFDGVAFEYSPGRPALRDLTFRADPGTRIALVGSSGAGKSTLASLLLRLYDPDRGQVRIDGRDIRDFTLASLRSQISVVLQDSLLFAATVRDNIAYGATGCSDEEVVAAARLANADEFVRSLPKGYDTVLSERGVSLSGGQRQRLAIARAAVRRAPILIFDEPTNGLDEANRQEVLAALERLAASRTTLWIAHDPELARRADQVLFVEAGRVVESGTPEELLAGPSRFSRLLDLRELSMPRRGLHAVS
jgi:ATP-binding cassette subfamily B protein